MPDTITAEFPPLPEYAGNPFIEKLPQIRSMQDIQRSFQCPPLIMEVDRRRPPEQRLHAVLRLLHYSQPTIPARNVGLKVDQMIRQSYIGRNPSTSQWMRFANACMARESEEKENEKKRRGRRSPSVDEVLGQLTPIRDTSMSCLVIGPPGMGKTHSARTALAHYDQVVFHEKPIQMAQITWLRIECPPDGSLVSLCRFFFAAVDKALQEAGFESTLHAQYKRAPLAVLLTGMARVANIHAIGILVVDEVQHVKISHGEGSALLNFLVTLRNTIGVSLLMIGTMSALPVLQRTFRDARRADGIGSIQFNRMAPAIEEEEEEEEEEEDPEPSVDPDNTGEAEEGREEVAQPLHGDEDGTEEGHEEVAQPLYGNEFEVFMRAMWRWQYTNAESDLTVEVLNAFYEETQGIIDLVVKLFILCQMHLMTFTSARPKFEEIIEAELVHEVANSSFNTVRPFIQALRDNDVKALREYEDIIGFSDWFLKEVKGMGLPETTPMHDDAHGALRLPPMIVEGSIDRAVVDQLLEGLGVTVDDREILMARHRTLIETGDLAGLVVAVRADLDSLKTRGSLSSKRPQKVPPIEGDLRTTLDGATDAQAVAEALGGTPLKDMLDE